jgi:hypothetical protein
MVKRICTHGTPAGGAGSNDTSAFNTVTSFTELNRPSSNCGTIDALGTLVSLARSGCSRKYFCPTLRCASARTAVWISGETHACACARRVANITMPIMNTALFMGLRLPKRSSQVSSLKTTTSVSQRTHVHRNSILRRANQTAYEDDKWSGDFRYVRGTRGLLAWSFADWNDSYSASYVCGYRYGCVAARRIGVQQFSFHPAPLQRIPRPKIRTLRLRPGLAPGYFPLPFDRDFCWCGILCLSGCGKTRKLP